MFCDLGLEVVETDALAVQCSIIDMEQRESERIGSDVDSSVVDTRISLGTHKTHEINKNMVEQVISDPARLSEAVNRLVESENQKGSVVEIRRLAHVDGLVELSKTSRTSMTILV